MRKYLFAIGMFLTLCACSEEPKVKATAVEGAKEKFREETKIEVAKAITGKDFLQAIVVRVLTETSDFKVQNVEIQGVRADVRVDVLTVPEKARIALLEIIEKLDPKKVDRFNVPDALKLILQEMGLTETRSPFVYKIKLEKSDRWNVVKDKK